MGPSDSTPCGCLRLVSSFVRLCLCRKMGKTRWEVSHIVRTQSHRTSVCLGEQTLAHPKSLISCVTVSELLSLSEPQTPYLGCREV